MNKYVAYYRVSTAKQGDSGLGLDGQKESVRSYIKDDQLILGEFTDIESGKKDNRPELMKAIELAKLNGAKLVIAKLDRLSRNLTFISSLMDNKVSFVCCDMPEANEFSIHIFAALAQQERKMISERTRKALEAKKKKIKAGNLTNSKRNTDGSLAIMKPDKNGKFRLGNPNGFTEMMRERAIEVKKQKSIENESTKRALRAIRKEIQYNPTISLSKLAEELNAQMLTTPTGNPFTRHSVAYLKKVLNSKLLNNAR